MAKEMSANQELNLEELLEDSEDMVEQDMSKTLKEYDLLLSGYSFFRVQQSHLVNLDFIDRYDKIDGGAVIMKDGSSVPLSPAKKEQFSFTVFLDLSTTRVYA